MQSSLVIGLTIDLELDVQGRHEVGQLHELALTVKVQNRCIMATSVKVVSQDGGIKLTISMLANGGMTSMYMCIKCFCSLDSDMHSNIANSGYSLYFMRYISHILR